MRNKINALCNIVTYIVIRHILTLILDSIEAVRPLGEMLTTYTGLDNIVDNTALILLIPCIITALILDKKHNK